VSQIRKKFIGNDQVGAAKIRLENDATLRARNAADTNDVDVLKVGTDDAIHVGADILPDSPGRKLGTSSASFDSANINKLDLYDSIPYVYLQETVNNTNYIQLYTQDIGSSLEAYGDSKHEVYSGDLTIQVHDATKKIKLVDSSIGTVGHIWTSTGTGGEGAWTAAPGITELTGDVTAGPGNGSQAATISADAVDGSKIRLENDEYLRARNFADNADINILKVGADDSVMLGNGSGEIILNAGTSGVAVQVDAPQFILRNGDGLVSPRLELSNADATQSIAISAPDNLAAVYALTLPDDVGSAGEVLSTDGSGVLSWISASASFAKETKVLNGTDITNQYIDLAVEAKANSVQVLVAGAGAVLEGASYQYSVSYTGGSGGVTRITFENELATGGASELVATDVLQIQYVEA